MNWTKKKPNREDWWDIDQTEGTVEYPTRKAYLKKIGHVVLDDEPIPKPEGE